MKRIVFLDIDGILTSVKYDRQRSEQDENIDETRLVLLEELADSTNAEIVLTSSWRKHWDQSAEGCDSIGIELTNTFEKYGLKITDKTPVISALERSVEIRAWLEKHSGQIESFVIPDDMFGGWGELEDSLVKTDSRIGRGLESHHIEKARAVLQKGQR
ncbi:MAG: hypothetical protein IJW49_04025 [Clostridia bacterium]|nr:hypothetical protein [Clostridia bacterium]